MVILLLLKSRRNLWIVGELVQFIDKIYGVPKQVNFYSRITTSCKVAGLPYIFVVDTCFIRTTIVSKKRRETTVNRGL